MHDELDIDPGQIRVKFGGGDNGHNGLRSIRSALGAGDFFRVRVGVGRPPGRQDPGRLPAVVTSPPGSGRHWARRSPGPPTRSSPWSPTAWNGPRAASTPEPELAGTVPSGDSMKCAIVACQGRRGRAICAHFRAPTAGVPGEGPDRTVCHGGPPTSPRVRRARPRRLGDHSWGRPTAAAWCTPLSPGTRVDTPVGTSFQFRRLRPAALRIVIMTTPAWPGPTRRSSSRVAGRPPSSADPGLSVGACTLGR